MNKINIKKSAWVLGLMAVLLFLWGPGGHAAIDGETGTTFALEAKQDNILTSDGDSAVVWGYALAGSRMQYPGPTLIVEEGQLITVTLKNSLSIPAKAKNAGISQNTSIVFPGQEVAASGTGPEEGLLTLEARPGKTVTYTFTASNPGTYLYRSGTQAGFQVEMGLLGVLIVRPAMGANFAYNHADTEFNREFLYLMTEMDPQIHYYVESGQWDQIDMSDYFATNWFVNGRNFPDLLADPGVPWLPTQPYNAQPIMHPGDKTLIRYIGGGRDLHPMHFHGNDFDAIAVDGRMLSSGPGAGPDLAWKATTIQSVPGQTLDFIWQWTGEKLGWDVYGHVAGDPSNPGCNDGDVDGFDDQTSEYCADHNKPFPVILPERDSVAFGELYPGSPFLGGVGELPPGHPGLNAIGAYMLIWHSHTEKEITSNDVFPGGAITFMFVVDHSIPLD